MKEKKYPIGFICVTILKKFLAAAAVHETTFKAPTPHTQTI